MKLWGIQHFAEANYKMTYWASKQKDRARKKPRILASTIFSAIVYQAVLGKGSLLQEDQWLRTPEAKVLHKSQRPLVASDTTLLRALGKWELEPTREALYARHLHLREQGHASVILSTGRKIKLAIVDGTQQGVLGTSALAMAGNVYHLIDAEPSPGRGHELKTSRRVLVYAQGGIYWEGLKEPLKLAWVKEKHLKGKYKGQTLTFWVITTDESLTAEQVGSKKRYIKNLKVKEALVLIWGLGMSLLM